jgi:hypothetical protein
MLTMNGLRRVAKSFLSFMIEFTLRFEIIKVLLISFMAKSPLMRLPDAFQTFPNPPLPITSMKLKD